MLIVWGSFKKKYSLRKKLKAVEKWYEGERRPRRSRKIQKERKRGET